MSNKRLMWVSVETRASGLYVAKSDSEPTFFLTATSVQELRDMIPVAIMDLFDRVYGEKVFAVLLEEDNDNFARQPLAVLPEELMRAHG